MARASPGLIRYSLCGLLALAAVSARSEELWPDLSQTTGGAGGGERDAAVIVGAERYFVVEPVPGARRNAEDWHAYLTEALKVPPERVALLRDQDATVEEIRQAAAARASEVEPGGTLWFVFVGHGAPSKDGKDGLLVGVDAQKRVESIQARSLSRSELLGILAKGKQARTVVLLDACFSGLSHSGRPLVDGLQPLVARAAPSGGLDPRTVLLTAARSDQFAGALPRARDPRPAFSYLALGALRGWAADASGDVSAQAVVDFARKALRLARDRLQTPELAAGPPEAVLGRGREAPPNLGRIDREAPPSAGLFRVSELPEIPLADGPPSGPAALDFRGVDVKALAAYDAAVQVEKSDAVPEAKAKRWRQLAREQPSLAEAAEKRGAAWDRFAAQREAAEAARLERLEARDSDWAKLSELLGLSVVPDADKKRWASDFIQSYRKSPGLEPFMAKVLVEHVAPGKLRKDLASLAKRAPQIAFFNRRGEDAVTLFDDPEAARRVQEQAYRRIGRTPEVLALAGKAVLLYFCVSETQPPISDFGLTTETLERFGFKHFARSSELYRLSDSRSYLGPDREEKLRALALRARQDVAHAPEPGDGKPFTYYEECSRVMPLMERFFDEYALKGLRVVGLTLGAPEEALREMGRTNGQLLGSYSGHPRRIFGDRVPTMALIDRSGNIVDYRMGSILGTAVFDRGTFPTKDIPKTLKREGWAGD